MKEVKKCIDCGKILSGSTKYLPGPRRCFNCYRHYKSESMKGENNIAKRKDVRAKLSAKMQGEFGDKNRNWKSGEITEKYILVYNPSHPYTNSRRYIRKHRLIMEKHLGRILSPEETVHHKDENILNNDLSNLQLFSSRGEHRRHHVPKGTKIGEKKTHG